MKRYDIEPSCEDGWAGTIEEEGPNGKYVVKNEHLQHWGAVYDIMQHPEETDEEFKARIVAKLRRIPAIGTREHLEQVRVNVMYEIPVSVRLGPFMVLGVPKRFCRVFTWVAFWLLKRAGWQLTEGGQ